jgi:hypothetical protein
VSVLHRFPSFLLACVLSLACLTPCLVAQENSSADAAQATEQKAEAKDEVTESVQPDVDKGATEQVDEARQKILSEAVTAVDQTKKALKALDEGDNAAALEALERATGKLELILARDPDLALAPAATTVKTFDLFATRGTIEKAIDEVAELLEDGEVQKARALISSLASEVVVSVSHIPLATYPDAIKRVAPLIDKGEYEEAKVALQTALNTIVVVDHVIPLPVLRAEAMLNQAEALAENDERTDEQGTELDDLLSGAREQLEMAQLLGYGDQKDFKPLFTEWESIAKKTSDGKSGTGFFDKLRKNISGIFN